MDSESAVLLDLIATRSAMAYQNDGFPALQIRYIGDASYCKIVVSGAYITSSDGETDGSETANSDFGASGVVSLANGSYDTLGELVDYIHGLDDYECVQRNGLRADSTNGKILAAAAAEIKTVAGAILYWDCSACKGAPLSVTNLHTAFSDYSPGTLPADPYDLDDDYKHGIFGTVWKSTYSAGSQTIEFYNGADKIFDVDAGATTVQETLGDNWGGQPVEASQGNVFTVKSVNDTTSDTAIKGSARVIRKSMI